MTVKKKENEKKKKNEKKEKSAKRRRSPVFQTTKHLAGPDLAELSGRDDAEKRKKWYKSETPKEGEWSKKTRGRPVKE